MNSATTSLLRLMSIRQRLEQVGKEVVGMLLQLIEGTEVGPTIPLTELVTRPSA